MSSTTHTIVSTDGEVETTTLTNAVVTPRSKEGKSITPSAASTSPDGVSLGGDVTKTPSPSHPVGTVVKHPIGQRATNATNNSPSIITVSVGSATKGKTVMNRPTSLPQQQQRTTSLKAGGGDVGDFESTRAGSLSKSKPPRPHAVYESQQCLTLRDAASCVDFLHRCQQRPNVAVHAMWGNGPIRTREVHPLFIGFSLALEGNVVVPTQILEHSTVLPAMRRFFESRSVRKFIWDGRVLGDYCYHRLRATLENTFDVCLCIAQTPDYQDTDKGRAERGVVRLPLLRDFLHYSSNPRMNTVSTTHLLLLLGQQQLLEAPPEVLANMPRMSKAMSQVLVPKVERTYAYNEVNWLLPLGILDPTEVVPAGEHASDSSGISSSSNSSSNPHEPKGGQLCSNCQRTFRSVCFSIRYVNKCRVCLELALPCSQEKELGECLDSMCPYTHYGVPSTGATTVPTATPSAITHNNSSHHNTHPQANSSGRKGSVSPTREPPNRAHGVHSQLQSPVRPPQLQQQQHAINHHHHHHALSNVTTSVTSTLSPNASKFTPTLMTAPHLTTATTSTTTTTVSNGMAFPLTAPNVAANSLHSLQYGHYPGSSQNIDSGALVEGSYDLFPQQQQQHYPSHHIPHAEGGNGFGIHTPMSSSSVHDTTGNTTVASVVHGSSKSASKALGNASVDPVPLFGSDGKSLPKIFLLRNAPTPCHFYFEGGCHMAQNCPMSHEPVPVYVPIPIPVVCTSAQQVICFQPCKHFRDGYCRKGQACQYQHLPDEILTSEGIPWTQLMH